MADKQASKAKKNRRKFMQFFKRVRSELTKMVKTAAKLPGRAQAGIEKWSADVSRAVHRNHEVRERIKRIDADQARNRIESEKKRFAKSSKAKPDRKAAEYSPRDRVEASYQLFGNGSKAEELTDAQIKEAFADIRNKAKASNRKAAARIEDKQRVKQSPGFRGWTEDGKPIREWTEWAKAEPRVQEKSNDAQRRLRGKDPVAKAIASAPTTIKVPDHDLKTSKNGRRRGHERPSTPKERQAGAAAFLQREKQQPQPFNWDGVQEASAKNLLDHQDRAIEAFKSAKSKRQRQALGDDIVGRIPDVNAAMKKLPKGDVTIGDIFQSEPGQRIGIRVNGQDYEQQ